MSAVEDKKAQIDSLNDRLRKLELTVATVYARKMLAQAQLAVLLDAEAEQGVKDDDVLPEVLLELPDPSLDS